LYGIPRFPTLQKNILYEKRTNLAVNIYTSFFICYLWILILFIRKIKNSLLLILSLKACDSRVLLFYHFLSYNICLFLLLKSFDLLNLTMRSGLLLVKSTCIRFVILLFIFYSFCFLWFIISYVNMFDIVIAPAKTGKVVTNKIAVIKIVQTNKGK